MSEFKEAVERIFGKSTGKSLSKEEFVTVTTEIFKIPKIFNDMLFTRIEQKQGTQGLPKLGGTPKINKQILLKFWDALDNHRKDPKRRLFDIIAKEGSNFIVGEDFKPMFKHLLVSHPGLEFL